MQVSQGFKLSDFSRAIKDLLWSKETCSSLAKLYNPLLSLLRPEGSENLGSILTLLLYALVLPGYPEPPVTSSDWS